MHAAISPRRTPRVGLVPLTLLLALSTHARAHSPHDVIDAVAISPNYAVDRTIFCASEGTIDVFAVSTDGGLTWQESRSGLRGTHIKRILMMSDWATSGEMYVISDAGLQVSTDGGATWARTGVERKYLLNLECSPVRAGDRALALFYASAGNMFRSDDRGVGEVPLALPLLGATIEAIAVSPTYWTDSTVAVTTSDARLLISTNAGVTWTSTALPAIGGHVGFSGTFSTDQRMWVATWGAGVIGSQNGGTTFGPSGPGLDDLFVNDVSVVDALVPGATPAAIYASTKDDGVYQSSDGGATWFLTNLVVELTYQTTNHFTHVQASATWHTDGGAVVCGTYEGIQLTEDGGLSWRESLINPTRAGRLTAFSPTYAVDDTVFGIGYGGPLLVSDTRGDFWTPSWRGIESNSLYSLHPSPDFATDGTILAGGGATPSGVSMYRSTDGGQSYTHQYLPPHPAQCDPFNNGLGYEIKWIAYSPNFTQDRTALAISHLGVVYRTVDAGVTWSLNGPPVSPRCWIKQIVLSPSFHTDGIAYATGSGLFRSTNGGQSFTELSSTSYPQLAIPADFKTTGELFGVTFTGEFVRFTFDGAIATPSGTGLDGFRVTTLVVSPNIAVDNTVIVGTSGGGVFESTDRGVTWQRVTTLGSIADHLMSLAISPNYANDQTLLAGTLSGHVRSTDRGRTWQLVTEFEIYDDSRDPWRDHGAWVRVGKADAITGGVRESTSAGDTMVLEFVGHRVRVFGAFGPDHGIVEARVDGQLVGVVDTYDPVASSHELFLDHRAPFGRHELELRVTGQRNPLSTSPLIGIDSAEVYYSTTGSYIAIDDGCVGSTGFAPGNDAVTGTPTVGALLRIQVSNARPNQPLSAVILGLAVLNIDLSLFGASGCVLVPENVVTLPAPTDASGVGIVDIALANDPLLVGFEFFTQPAIADPGINPFGVVLGVARRATVALP